MAAPAHTRARAGLVVGSAALLALALVALLVVNVSLERGAYELRHQRAEAQRLTDARDALAEQLRAAGAPQQLARRAGDLGMVPAGGVAFIQSGTGAISGTPQPGTGSGR